jgi:glutathione peroxidase
MTRPRLLLLTAALFALTTSTGATEPDPTIYEHRARTIEGEDVGLEAYRGQVLLIVNTASKCGFTGQYKDLEAVHQRFQDRGFAVLGFPCNDFGGQEPGSEADIQSFCEERYGVSFPLFAKVKVKGEGTHPLFSDLQAGTTRPDSEGPIRWNFTKFLVGRDGRVVARFGSMTSPSSKKVAKAIEAALAVKAPTATKPGGGSSETGPSETPPRTETPPRKEF